MPCASFRSFCSSGLKASAAAPFFLQSFKPCFAQSCAVSGSFSTMWDQPSNTQAVRSSSSRSRSPHNKCRASCVCSRSIIVRAMAATVSSSGSSASWSSPSSGRLPPSPASFGAAAGSPSSPSLSSLSLSDPSPEAALMTRAASKVNCFASSHRPCTLRSVAFVASSCRHAGSACKPDASASSHFCSASSRSHKSVMYNSAMDARTPAN
mmetsp:Transcript_20954/g.60502  ORF Transcript_20954/g.60502 Transcript_20954/m.60502 type:complete len:209 (-) Transcript_20954:721-1347(-)